MNSRLRVRRLLFTVSLTLPALAHPLGAQQRDSTIADSSKAATAPREVSALRVGAGLALTAVAVAPFDVAITRRLRSGDLQRSASWRAGAVIFDAYGAPGSQIAGPLLAIAGSLIRNPTLSEVGIHVTESYAAAGVGVLLVKGIAGRARPYTVSAEHAYDFELGRGFPHREPYSSFPSGHATGSFAFASSITVEAARHWPEHATLIGVLAYSGAFLDGVSRVYRDSHWPSDVAAGALVGTMSGLLVTRYQHARPTNRMDAFARHVTFAPKSSDAFVVGVSGQF
jgi:undecaprenyl-diphosphatase